MMLLAAGLIFAAAAALCMAMERHQVQVLMARLQPASVTALRIATVLLLLAAYGAAAAAKGWAIGAVAWFSLCAATLSILVLLLTYAPRLLPRLALFGLAAGGLAGLAGLYAGQ